MLLAQARPTAMRQAWGPRHLRSIVPLLRGLLQPLQRPLLLAQPRALLAQPLPHNQVLQRALHLVRAMLLQLPHFSLGPLHCYSALGLIESARGLILVLVCLEHCIWIYSLSLTPTQGHAFAVAALFLGASTLL